MKKTIFIFSAINLYIFCSIKWKWQLYVTPSKSKFMVSFIALYEHSVSIRQSVQEFLVPQSIILSYHPRKMKTTPLFLLTLILDHCFPIFQINKGNILTGSWEFRKISGFTFCSKILAPRILHKQTELSLDSNWQAHNAVIWPVEYY